MINFFSGMDSLFEGIFKAKLAESFTIPEVPSFPEIEEVVPEADPKEITGSGGTGGRKRMQRKVSEGAQKLQEESQKLQEEAKEKIAEARKAAEDSVKQAQEDIKNQINDAISANKLAFQDFMADAKDLGVSIGELTVSCVTLPTRLMSLAGSIICICPMGPGANVPAIPKGIQDLKQIGDDMGTKYDKVTSGISKLGLDALDKLASNPVVQLMGLAEVLGGAGTLVSSIMTVLNLVKPFIMMVGGSCGSESGGTPEVETPQVTGYTATPDTCTIFSPIVTWEDPDDDYRLKWEVTCENCKNYSPMDSEASRTCQNCLKYKEKVK